MSDQTLFSGFAETAQPREAGNYFLMGMPENDGVFRLRVGTCTYKAAFRKTGQPGVAIEFEILESNVPGHPVGSTAAWITKQNDATPSSRAKWFGELLNFIGALCGTHPRLDRDHLAQAIKLHGESLLNSMVTAQAMKGWEVMLHAHVGDTKSGGRFTYHDFFPVVRGTSGKDVAGRQADGGSA